MRTLLLLKGSDLSSERRGKNSPCQLLDTYTCSTLTESQMCGGLVADPKDNKVGKLILPSRSSQGNEGEQQHFHCDLESSRALLCCSLRIEGSLPPRLPATLHDLPGEARSPRPSITRGCPKKPGQHCIPRAQLLPSGEMCPRWGSCLCGG